VDNLLSHNPLFYRPIIGNAQDAEELADKVENGVKAIFDEMALLEPLLTGKQVNRHHVAYGYTILEGPLKTSKGRPRKPTRTRGMSDQEWESREAQWENEKRTWMPFRVKSPHPSWVLLDPQEKMPSIAIKHAPRYARDLHILTRELKASGFKGVDLFDIDSVKNPYQEIMCDEWWDEDWHYLMTSQGQILFGLANPAKYVPFGHAFSGWGNYPTGTDSTSTLDPKYLAHGILDDTKESLRANAQFASAWHNALVLAAFRNKYTTGDAEAIIEQEERGSETIIEVDGGKETMWWEETPDMPNWLFEGNRLLLQDIEFATFAQAVAGIREQGVVTVGQQAILSTAANRRFVSPQLQAQHLWSNAGKNLLRLIDMTGEKFTVSGKEIGPNDIKHDYSISATLEVVDPVLLMQEREIALREFEVGLISDTDYRALARKGDETGIRERIIKQQARELPEFKIRLIADALREEGMAELAEQLLNPPQEPGVNGQSTQPANSNQNNALLNAGRDMRQALTPNTPGQPRSGQAFAGSNGSRVNQPL